ncbi:hypothetical protein CCR75_001039 [Bremia lactucae]|uniref:Uncharacterized protein n=1 Tax=Bremia lactucae TaxID=4779 RepID=A0A976IHE1_BRELC|nr:hypothetical protein CCR75_001039 [Bremia lactucae]
MSNITTTPPLNIVTIVIKVKCKFTKQGENRDTHPALSQCARPSRATRTTRRCIAQIPNTASRFDDDSGDAQQAQPLRDTATPRLLSHGGRLQTPYSGRNCSEIVDATRSYDAIASCANVSSKLEEISDARPLQVDGLAGRVLVAVCGAVQLRSMFFRERTHPDAVTRDAQHRVSTLRHDVCEESRLSDRAGC